MKYYRSMIISQKEMQKIFGEELKFSDNGFISHKNKVDFWNEIEKYFCIPVVSIRPSGRNGWDEVIIIFAEGWIDNKKNKRILDYADGDVLKSVLTDIFAECENDEYEVFDSYGSTCPIKTWKNIEKWVHETW